MHLSLFNWTFCESTKRTWPLCQALADAPCPPSMESELTCAGQFFELPVHVESTANRGAGRCVRWFSLVLADEDKQKLGRRGREAGHKNLMLVSAQGCPEKVACNSNSRPIPGFVSAVSLLLYCQTDTRALLATANPFGRAHTGRGIPV